MDIICNICKKTLNDCKNLLIGSNLICPSCNVCKSCVKSQYAQNNTICNTCCNKCNKCNKFQIKNNWPIDVIINNLCEKCYKSCSLCNKTLTPKKSFIMSPLITPHDPIFCESCFTSTKLVPPNTSLFKFNMIVSSIPRGNLVTGYDKTHAKINCINCNKLFFSNIKKGSNVCLICSKKNVVLKDPSNDTIKYKYLCKKWVPIYEKKDCHHCFVPIWIKIKKTSETSLFSCKNCKPLYDKLYTYVKEDQLWTPSCKGIKKIIN